MPVVIVPALAGIAIALIALIVLYGFAYLVRALAHVLPVINLGVYHVDLPALVQALADAALKVIEAGFDAVLRPVGQFLLAPIEVFFNIIHALYSGIASLVVTAEWVITSFIPRELSHLGAELVADIDDVIGLVKTKFAQVLTIVARDLAAAEAYALARVDALAQLVSRDLTAVERAVDAVTVDLAKTVAADVAKAEAAATALVSALGRTVAADLVKAEQFATASVTTLGKVLASDVAGLSTRIESAVETTAAATIGIISTDIDQAAKASEAALAGGISGVIDIAAGGFGDITQWLGQIDLTKSLDIAGVTTIAVATAGALTKYLEDCGIPNCRNLSQFGRDLAALLGFAEDAAFLAFLIALASDPQGTADDVVTVFDDIADPVISTVKSLFGVS